MSLIKKVKDGYFTIMTTLLSKGFIKMYKDRLIITVNGDVIYKGKNYDKYKGTGKAHSINANGKDEKTEREIRSMLDDMLKREGLI